MSEVIFLAVTPDSEELIEEAGRTAYMSFNQRKEGSEKKFIRMIIRSGHESVLEHAYATFRFKGVSRAFTHQLVRHRLCAFTQKSQRHVDESNFDFVIPPSISEDSEGKEKFEDTIRMIRDAYNFLRYQEGIKKEDARFILPNATETEIVVSANFRQWRHMLKLRTDPNAQWEIRKVFNKVLFILKGIAPTVFEDFECVE